ncbi:right-handed parallel beta-helix repeat-containing protein, partial [Myxococcus sp. AM009]|nr:right-handed parallel beta-helix repeat-containing protein [Myxococcus sp. AM009]
MKAFRRSRSLFALPVVLVLAACSSGPEDRPAPGDDAGVTDGGADAGTPDSGTDAGVTDSGTDAGTPDAGPDIEVPEDGGTIVRGTLTGRLTVGGSPYR